VAGALWRCQANPLVIDIDDSEYDRPGEVSYEALLAGGVHSVLINAPEELRQGIGRVSAH
jgi:hypothetical protein